MSLPSTRLTVPSEYRFTVKENLLGALVANLSQLDFGGVEERFGDMHIVGGSAGDEKEDDEGRRRFSITDSGLLFTKVRLSDCVGLKLHVKKYQDALRSIA